MVSYHNSVARDNPNPQEGCEGLGAVGADQEAPTTSTRRVTYGALTPSTSLSRFEKVLNESFKGSLRQASASFDEKAGGLVPEHDDEFPEKLKVVYPKQCGALCGLKALNDVTWSRWSLYCKFMRRMIQEVNKVGGAPAVWKPQLLYVFEVYTGTDGGADRTKTMYALVSALRGAAGGGTSKHTMWQYCHIVEAKPGATVVAGEEKLNPVTARRGRGRGRAGVDAASKGAGRAAAGGLAGEENRDEHIGLVLEMTREAYVQSKREDILGNFIGYC